jgi:hypothetical protein
MHGCLDGEEHEEPGWKSVTERESSQASYAESSRGADM